MSETCRGREAYGVREEHEAHQSSFISDVVIQIELGHVEDVLRDQSRLLRVGEHQLGS